MAASTRPGHYAGRHYEPFLGAMSLGTRHLARDPLYSKQLRQEGACVTR